MAEIRGYRKKTNFKGFFITIFFIAIITLVYFIGKSDIFENKVPEIIVEEEIGSYWNPQREAKVVFKDASSIRDYAISATLENGTKLLDIQEVVLDKPKEVSIKLPVPEVKLEEGMKVRYEIEVSDWSNTNFFSGNTAKKTFDFVVDFTSPKVEMIASSFAITYGGSALLVFKAEEPNLKSLVVSNGIDEFKAFPYIQNGYYATLIAWPIKNKSFMPSIVATDMAGNKTIYKVAMVKHLKGYRNSNLKLQEKDFLKVKSMVEGIGKRMPSSFASSPELFAYLNETIRQEDESEIFQASNSFKNEMITSVPVFEKFYPLKGGQVVGSFGDSRHYYFKDANISNSFHLGLDLASVKNAPILASNAGEIVLQKKLGLYGNTVVVYHGLGLSSSYSHISKFNLALGDKVRIKDVLAYTGATGWAFGDHLHFGILVQGHFVWIAEWMDSKWIKNNITGVLQKAYQSIKEGGK